MPDPESVGNQSREECEEGIDRMMTNPKMGVSMEATLFIARLDEMGVLALHDGQTLADLAMAIDAIQMGEPTNGEPARSEAEMQQRMEEESGTESKGEVDLVNLRGVHVETTPIETTDGPITECFDCGQVWPCDAIQLASEVGQLREIIQQQNHDSVNEGSYHDTRSAGPYNERS